MYIYVKSPFYTVVHTLGKYVYMYMYMYVHHYCLFQSGEESPPHRKKRHYEPPEESEEDKHLSLVQPVLHILYMYLYLYSRMCILSYMYLYWCVMVEHLHFTDMHAFGHYN